MDNNYKCREGVAVISDEFNTSMEIIMSALHEKGYDPYAQIYGYLQEGNPMYITQHRDARDLIQNLDKKRLRQYIALMK